MKIRVVAFATAAEALGGPELALDLPAESTLGELRRELAARSPALAARMKTIAIAVDGELANDTHALADGSEVALLPPVSGG